MANSLSGGVYYVDSTGKIKERSDKADTDPIRVKAFVLTSGEAAGAVTFTDNKSTPNSLFSLKVGANQSIVLSFGESGFVFPFGLNVSAITGTLSIFIG